MRSRAASLGLPGLHGSPATRQRRKHRQQRPEIPIPGVIDLFQPFAKPLNLSGLRCFISLTACLPAYGSGWGGGRA